MERFIINEDIDLSGAFEEPDFEKIESDIEFQQELNDYLADRLYDNIKGR